MDDIYLKIKNIRLAKNLTQEDISKHLGMAQSNYARLERGLSQITIERLREIARIFEMTPEAVISYSEQTEGLSEDAKFYRDEAKKLEGKVEKLKKELIDKDEIQTQEIGSSLDEKAKKNKVISELKKEVAQKEEIIKEKIITIEKLEKEIEEKNKSINHLQESNSKLIEMLGKMTK